MTKATLLSFYGFACIVTIIGAKSGLSESSLNSDQHCCDLFCTNALMKSMNPALLTVAQ